MKRLLMELLAGRKCRQLRYRTAYVLFMMIVIGGSIPHAREDIGHLAPGVILHGLAYAILTYLLWSGSASRGRAAIVRTWLTVAAMGAIDESVQAFFPYRRAAVGDWLIDCTAGAATLLVLHFSLRTWPARTRGSPGTTRPDLRR